MAFAVVCELRSHDQVEFRYPDLVLEFLCIIPRALKERYSRGRGDVGEE